MTSPGWQVGYVGAFAVQGSIPSLQGCWAGAVGTVGAGYLSPVAPQTSTAPTNTPGASAPIRRGVDIRDITYDASTAGPAGVAASPASGLRLHRPRNSCWPSLSRCAAPVRQPVLLGASGQDCKSSAVRGDPCTAVRADPARQF